MCSSDLIRTAQRRFAPTVIGITRNRDRHRLGIVIGIAGIRKKPEASICKGKPICDDAEKRAAKNTATHQNGGKHRHGLRLSASAITLKPHDVLLEGAGLRLVEIEAGLLKSLIAAEH